MMTTFSCPLPPTATNRILLAHGGGGRLTNQLVESVFLPAFSNSALDSRLDGAVRPRTGPGWR
jgi:Hydrogenase maturation factor